MTCAYVSKTMCWFG